MPGGLLRKQGMGKQGLIEESKPISQPSSPFRELLRQTLMSNLPPGTERTAGVAPEGVVAPPSPAVTPSTYNPSPVGPTTFNPSPISPTNQTAPGISRGTPATPSPVAAPVGPSSGVLGKQTSSPSTQGGYNGPLPQSSYHVNQPQTSYASAQLNRPTPTPTPAPSSYNARIPSSGFGPYAMPIQNVAKQAQNLYEETIVPNLKLVGGAVGELAGNAVSRLTPLLRLPMIFPSIPSPIKGKNVTRY